MMIVLAEIVDGAFILFFFFPEMPVSTFFL